MWRGKHPQNGTECHSVPVAFCASTRPHRSPSFISTRSFLTPHDLSVRFAGQPPWPCFGFAVGARDSARPARPGPPGAYQHAESIPLLRRQRQSLLTSAGVAVHTGPWSPLAQRLVVRHPAVGRSLGLTKCWLPKPALSSLGDESRPGPGFISVPMFSESL